MSWLQNMQTGHIHSRAVPPYSCSAAARVFTKVSSSFVLHLRVPPLPRCYASLVILHLGTVAGPTLHSVFFCYVSLIDNISIHLVFCRQFGGGPVGAVGAPIAAMLRRMHP